jgi:hypothetical protein
MEDDAVALSEIEEPGHGSVPGVRIQLKVESDRAEANRSFLAHTKGPTKVDIALGVDDGRAELDTQRRGDGSERHAGTRHERLQQHVARAQLRAIAASGRVKSGLSEDSAGIDRAADGTALAIVAAGVSSMSGWDGLAARERQRDPHTERRARTWSRVKSYAS